MNIRSTKLFWGVLALVQVCFPMMGLALTLSGEIASPTTLTDAQIASLGSIREFVKLGADQKTYLGSYEVAGIELSRLIGRDAPRKTKDDGFNRELDMLIVVTGKSGKKAVFSYGELFLAPQQTGNLLCTDARFLLPHKHSDISKTNWLSDEWFSKKGNPAETAEKAGCAVCHNGTMQKKLMFPKTPFFVSTRDEWPVRFVEDVADISVIRAPAESLPQVASQPKESMWVETPVFVKLDGSKVDMKPEMFAPLTRTFLLDCSFGLGKGFHGIHGRTGVELRSFVRNMFPPETDFSQVALIAASPDGYRASFSGAEVCLSQRFDNVLLIEQEEQKNLEKGEGKYKILSQSDFFVDRCLRSVAEIRAVLIK